MIKNLIVIMTILISSFGYAGQNVITVEGEKAKNLIKSVQAWVKHHPAYEKSLGQVFHCKAKNPKPNGKRKWGYTGCSNLSWFTYGTKTSYYLTISLVEALPESLKETLFLTKTEKKNKYTKAITVESLTCDESSCEIIYNPNNQDRSGLNF